MLLQMTMTTRTRANPVGEGDTIAVTAHVPPTEKIDTIGIFLPGERGARQKGCQIRARWTTMRWSASGNVKETGDVGTIIRDETVQAARVGTGRDDEDVCAWL